MLTYLPGVLQSILLEDSFPSLAKIAIVWQSLIHDLRAFLNCFLNYRVFYYLDLSVAHLNKLLVVVFILVMELQTRVKLELPSAMAEYALVDIRIFKRLMSVEVLLQIASRGKALITEFTLERFFA